MLLKLQIVLNASFNMKVFGIIFQALLQVLSFTSILGYSFGPDRCDVPTDGRATGCGYYGIKETECIQRGCCWKPCENCTPDTPWCIKSREMGRPECQQKPESKKDCGYSGIPREECLRRSCCWSPSNIPNDAWCYYESEVSVPTTAPPETEAPAIEEGKLRIMGSGASGRLQIYLSGEWGTICDDGFDMNAAAIACRQLGLDATNAQILERRNDQKGMGQILLDDVSCIGTEDNIMSCDHSSPGVNDCGHHEDVVISCEPPTQSGVEGSGSGSGESSSEDTESGDSENDSSESGSSDRGDSESGDAESDDSECGDSEISDTESGDTESDSSTEKPKEGSIANPGEGDLRLVQGDRTSAGFLEVYYGEWGTVCDDYFNNNAAQVACRQLGYSDTHNAVMLPTQNDYNGPGAIMLDNVLCYGNESKLVDCVHHSWGSHDCTNAEAVQIDCAGRESQTEVETRDINRSKNYGWNFPGFRQAWVQSLRNRAWEDLEKELRDADGAAIL